MKEVDTASTPRPLREPSLQAARCDHNISAVLLCLCTVFACLFVLPCRCSHEVNLTAVFLLVVCVFLREILLCTYVKLLWIKEGSESVCMDVFNCMTSYSGLLHTHQLQQWDLLNQI